MRHIDELQIAGTALLLCGAMFAVSAVAPKGESISKAVTNFTEAPETAAEAQAQAEAAAEDAGFTIYTQESNYDYDESDESDYDSSYDDSSYDDTSSDDTYSGDIQQDYPNPDTGDSGSTDDGSSNTDTGDQESPDIPDDSEIEEDDPTQIIYPSDDSGYDDSGDSGDNSDSYDNTDFPAPDDTGDQSGEQAEDSLE